MSLKSLAESKTSEQFKDVHTNQTNQLFFKTERISTEAGKAQTAQTLLDHTKKIGLQIP